MAVFPVVLDANVLYGVLTTDILLTTAGRRLYRAHWTDEIIDEARRNIMRKRPDVNGQSIERRFAAMNKAMPEARVDAPPDELIGVMTNDAADRHVLATAVMVKAELIVTENTKHFPKSACAPYGIETRTLDGFLTDLVSLNPAEVWASINEMASRRKDPPVTLSQIGEVLESYMPSALEALRSLGFNLST